MDFELQVTELAGYLNLSGVCPPRLSFQPEWVLLAGRSACMFPEAQLVQSFWDWSELPSMAAGR